jgi:hypothetical protein
MNLCGRTFARAGTFSLALAAAPAAVKELSGAPMLDTLSVTGKTLERSGLGLLKKAIFEVCVGGLSLLAAMHDQVFRVASPTEVQS